jgi:predicted O-methyltransferase YrrM
MQLYGQLAERILAIGTAFGFSGARALVTIRVAQLKSKKRKGKSKSGNSCK